MRRSGAAAVARRDSVSAPRPLIGCGALSWRAPSSEKPPLYPLSNRRAPPPPLLPPMPPPAPPLPLATRGSPDVPARGADVTTTYGDDVFPACPAWASPQGTMSVSAPAGVGEASAVGPMSSAATTSAARARSAAGTPRSSSATGVRRRPGLSSRRVIGRSTHGGTLGANSQVGWRNTRGGILWAGSQIPRVVKSNQGTARVCLSILPGCLTHI